jgi:predicted nucleic acid-binding protein
VTTKFPALNAEHVDTFLADLLSQAMMIDQVPAAFTLPRDPKDEPYLDLAIASNARYLVTWNDRHLTYLMRQDTPEGMEFCRRFPGLQIVTPPEVIKLVGQQP